MNLLDKNGRHIERGDVLKVYHFTGANRKRHYMYKQVCGTRTLGSGMEYAVIDHLDMDAGHYLECCDGRQLNDCEIVQSIDLKFEERSRSHTTHPRGAD
jgi:hypothetical protein